MIKLVRAFFFILKNKTSFTLKKPITNKFLLFDNFHIKLLNNYIDQKNIEILNVRLENINLYVVFIMLLKFKFRYIDYLAQYIILVNPKFVITFIDNKTLFSSLFQ